MFDSEEQLLEDIFVDGGYDPEAGCSWDASEVDTIATGELYNAEPVGYDLGDVTNRSYFADCERDIKGRCLPGEGGVTAPKKEVLASAKIAIEKINNAPVPGKEKVDKMRALLEKCKRDPNARPGGDARGNASDRKSRAKNLFKEFGGEEKGYVVCPWTGIKMHWAKSDDKVNNPKGYPKFEQGKIFTARQGGGYQLPNLIPESFTANRTRNDEPLRKENLK